MPWKESTAVNQRQRFIRDKIMCGASHAELCRRYGISRKTGYKWWERFQQDGGAALLDRSRAHARHPHTTSPEVAELILAIRHETKEGPRKIQGYLRRRYPGLKVPAASTIGKILRERGLTEPRRRRRAEPSRGPLGPQDQLHATWAMDFKGEFRTGDGALCHTFTLMETHSRFMLRCVALEHPRTELVIPILEAAFREHGLPQAIRSDNGPPFASQSFTGLTALAAWLVALGIRPDRIRPGNPQENGRLERFHKTLKATTASPPAQTIRAQQTRYNALLRRYNHERPHDALDGATPAETFAPSQRLYVGVAEPDYGHWATAKVHNNGCALIRGWEPALSRCLAGQTVGIQQISDTTVRIWFYDEVLADLDTSNGDYTNGVTTRRASDARARHRKWRDKTVRGASSLRSSASSDPDNSLRCHP